MTANFYQIVSDWCLKPLTRDDVTLFLIIYRERFGPMDQCWYLMARRRKRRSSFQVYGCRERVLFKRYLQTTIMCFEVRAIPSLSITREWWLHMSFVYGKQTTFDGCDGERRKIAKRAIFAPCVDIRWPLSRPSRIFLAGGERRLSRILLIHYLLMTPKVAPSVS